MGKEEEEFKTIFSHTEFKASFEFENPSCCWIPVACVESSELFLDAMHDGDPEGQRAISHSPSQRQVGHYKGHSVTRNRGQQPGP